MTCISSRNVYYDLGQKLTQNHVGKKVLMTEPYKNGDQLDYTFIPDSLENAFTLVWLSDSSAVVSRDNHYYHVSQEALAKWISLDEFQSAVQKIQGAVHFIHYGLPC